MGFMDFVGDVLWAIREKVADAVDYLDDSSSSGGGYNVDDYDTDAALREQIEILTAEKDKKLEAVKKYKREQIDKFLPAKTGYKPEKYEKGHSPARLSDSDLGEMDMLVKKRINDDRESAIKRETVDETIKLNNLLEAIEELSRAAKSADRAAEQKPVDIGMALREALGIPKSEE